MCIFKFIYLIMLAAKKEALGVANQILTVNNYNGPL